MTPPKKPKITAQSGKVRSLPLDRWPAADRAAWAAACRPSERLKQGGAAVPHEGHHPSATLSGDTDISSTMFSGRKVSILLPPPPVTSLLIELIVSSRNYRHVSFRDGHGSIYKLRRMVQLLDPARDFTWLIEIEEDLALVMQPKSKFGRLVYTNVLIDAGMMLMAEADAATHRSALARARQFRNGLMVAMLAFHPIRPGNFARS